MKLYFPLLMTCCAYLCGSACGEPPMTPASKPEVEEIKNAIGIELTLIPAGEFVMGVPGVETTMFSSEVGHKVAILRPFYLGTTEVTQSQWESVMGTAPWTDKPNVRVGPDFPASYVTWWQAKEFCRRLSKREKRVYRLPTEAEWEYACVSGERVGLKQNSLRVAKLAWYKGNTIKHGNRFPHAVAKRQPNSYGLYDIQGNLCEWCLDTYDPHYYADSWERDPVGPPEGDYFGRRVMRGGCWAYEWQSCLPTFRDALGADISRETVGFRVLLEHPETETLTVESARAALIRHIRKTDVNLVSSKELHGEPANVTNSTFELGPWQCDLQKRAFYIKLEIGWRPIDLTLAKCYGQFSYVGGEWKVTVHSAKLYAK